MGTYFRLSKIAKGLRPFVLRSVTFYLMGILLKFTLLICHIIFIAFLCSRLLYSLGNRFGQRQICANKRRCLRAGVSVYS